MQQPLGAATAEGVPTVGGAASRPAGEAIAPAKQNQRRSLLAQGRPDCRRWCSWRNGVRLIERNVRQAVAVASRFSRSGVISPCHLAARF